MRGLRLLRRLLCQLSPPPPLYQRRQLRPLLPPTLQPSRLLPPRRQQSNRTPTTSSSAGQYADSADEMDGDDAAIYSSHTVPHILAPPAAATTRPRLPMRLEGLAAAASVSRSQALSSMGGESFPVTPCIEVEESVLGAGWRKGR